MAVDPNRLAIDQLTRVLQSMGWEVVAVDFQGELVKVMVQRRKILPQAPS